jgi:hypothetical protein
MFRWFRKPRNLAWTDDVLIDARTDEVLAIVVQMEPENLWSWYRWNDRHYTTRGCPEAFKTKDGAKKFVEEKFR